MVSCSGSLVQSCFGEGGALQTDIAVCGEHSQCSGHTGFAPLTGVCSPHLHCSGSRLLCRERALCGVWFQFSGPPQKRGLGCACFLRLPRPSGSGSQGLAGRSLPGCVRLLPFAAPASVSTCARRVPAPCVSPRPSRRVWTIQNLRTSLNRDWRPACSAVGARSSGPSLPLSPPPCLQYPAGLGRSVV